jgi:hypothetical protein
MEDIMEDLGEKSPELEKEVEKDTPLKEWLVDYVGTEFQKKLGEVNEWDGSVTVEMIVEVASREFPEFMMAIAEENWIRGYHQALVDVKEGEKLYREELKKQEEKNVNEE